MGVSVSLTSKICTLYLFVQEVRGSKGFGVGVSDCKERVHSTQSAGEIGHVAEQRACAGTVRTALERLRRIEDHYEDVTL